MNLLSKLFTRSVLRLQPGDVVIFKVDADFELSVDQLDHIHNEFHDVFPKNRALVLQGVSIHKVISKGPKRVKVGDLKVEY